MDRFHALLVEGVPGIGKSTLIDALLRRYVERTAPRKIRTLLHLSQTFTYGPLAPAEDAGTLTADENVKLLERVLQTLEWLRHDFLQGSEQTIWSRSIGARQGSQFLEYARKFGRSPSDLHSHFVREQAAFLGLFEQSAMSKMAMTNNGSLEEIVEVAYRWWMARPLSSNGLASGPAICEQ